MITFKFRAAQHGVHADGWIRTAKMAFFVATGLLRFVGESMSRQPPVPITALVKG